VTAVLRLADVTAVLRSWALSRSPAAVPRVILVVWMEDGHKLLGEIGQVFIGTRKRSPFPTSTVGALSDLVFSESSCGRAVTLSQ